MKIYWAYIGISGFKEWKKKGTTYISEQTCEFFEGAIYRKLMILKKSVNLKSIKF